MPAKRKLLKCEMDTPEMAEEMASLVDDLLGGDVEAIFEHGQWWANNVVTGRQWSINDASGPGSTCGFSFEVVSEGI